MALAYLTINLDAFTGDDRPPVSQYSTITLDPGVDHIDAANDVIHVRSIVVSLDRQGKAATANGVPCVDGRVPVVAGVAYAVSAPNVLRSGPHYIPALTAAQVVDLSDYITPGAPLTPDQAATLTARIVALEAGGGGGGGGVTVHNLLTGRSTADAHPTSAITGLDAALTGKASTTHGHVIADTTGLQATLDAKAATSHTHTGVYAPALGADDNYVTGAEKAALHTHPAVIAQGATQADARTAIGAGTSSIVVGTGAGDAKAGNYQPTAANVSDSTTTGRALLTAADAAAARTTLALGTAATTASTAYATAAQGATADAALAAAAAPRVDPRHDGGRARRRVERHDHPQRRGRHDHHRRVRWRVGWWHRHRRRHPRRTRRGRVRNLLRDVRSDMAGRARVVHRPGRRRGSDDHQHRARVDVHTRRRDPRHHGAPPSLFLPTPSRPARPPGCRRSPRRIRR
jgi:hypothetical protein